MAEAFLSQISFELETNPFINHFYGRVKPENPNKWTDSEIELTNGARIIAVGAGKAIRGLLHHEGTRPDLVILDDIETDEVVRTIDQRAKFKEWFLKVVMNIGSADTSIWVIGTIMHYDSLLANLINGAFGGFVGKKYEAINESWEPASILFPQVWTLERLKEKKETIGTNAFASEFRNQPIDEETARIKRNWIKLYDTISVEHLDIYAAIDPAISKKETADYFAIVTIGVDRKNEDIYVLDVVRGRYTLEEQVNRILGVHARFHPSVIGIESVAYQQALKEVIDRVAPHIQTKAIKVDTDKERRVQLLSVYFERGHIHIRSDQQELIDELLTFPFARHDDQVDALGHAVDLAKEKPIETFTFRPVGW